MMNSRRRLPFTGAIFLVTLVIVFGAGYAAGSHTIAAQAQSQFTPPPGSETDFDAFWQAFNFIQDDFVNPGDTEVTTQSLVDGAIRGMVDSLGDPNSEYMNPEEYPLFTDDIAGTVEGIGVVIHNNEDVGGIEIVNVLDGTPAAHAGLKIGDVFSTVDGADVLGVSQLELASKVRGPAGTTVKLTMLREGKPIDFSLVRARIDVPNVESHRIEGTDIGYIRLMQFTPQAREEIDSALKDLDTSSLSGLILDLRGNPGGLLDSAIDVASAFIKEGNVVTEDFGNDTQRNFAVNGNYDDIGVPLVVLVDERSASASELVSGALQDSHTATIIGETTFGKGTVQNIQNLVNGGGLRLTIARWLTPSGHWIHHVGITPDIIVNWDSETLDVAPEEDPQLQAAIQDLETTPVTTSQGS